YLIHEDERMVISDNAYQFVREKHTYRHRIQKMLQDIQNFKKN
ncbi:MAG: glycosyltransferase family 1 protein, partial [Chloroflexia bacterium]|nr:glycosyltransferase family 1 protein [Chloroflexia bacterium]